MLFDALRTSLDFPAYTSAYSMIVASMYGIGEFARRIGRSRQRIAVLRVGMSGKARIKGRDRQVTITRVGRSQVAVAFPIETGGARTAELSARDFAVSTNAAGGVR